MENKSCFTIQNLSFSYGEKKVLHDINISIPSGKVVTLMGANGCGKSTLFRLLTKDLKPTQGDILLGNTSVSHISLRDFSKKVAIVHQNNTAPPDISVEQLVSYGRIPFTRMGHSLSKEKDAKIIAKAMQITGVYGFKDRPLSSLSGGQRQRVWIAMSLAQGTKILLLDEPTTYLDVRYQLQILKLVQMLNKKYGISIIMVLHDINQAIAYSDEIIALSPSGRLVAQGNPQEIISTPMLRHIYGIALETFSYEGKKLVLTQ